MDVEWVWNSFGIRGESIGNSYGIRLELICKSDGWFGNVLGMHRGCWGMSVEFIGNYYEFFGKQLVFIGNPWDISEIFGWEFIRWERSKYKLNTSTRMQSPLQNRASRSMYSQVFHFFWSFFSSLFLTHFWEGF